ncbi:flagellar basal-body rod protein FlgG [bacterium]|jgi:flagellar basal-body rod protein FlgG|nr:flagellar basal-body rod protein FlgG [bacterium]
MLKALNTSATGLEAQQANIDRIAHDLANVNTDGYKREVTEFQDLMYENIKDPGARQGASTMSPTGIQKGMGVKVGSNHKIFEQGNAKMTGNPYDLLIEGKGFLPVVMPNTGEMVYTRAGSFKLDSQGRMTLNTGALLQPTITVPPDATSVIISGTGEVKAVTAQGDQGIGQIQLANFINPQGLLALGNGLYKQTAASGQAQSLVPGEGGTGLLQQGALETSNVNVANSMIEMIGAQRGYEMNAKVMGVVDKILEATNNVVR